MFDSIPGSSKDAPPTALFPTNANFGEPDDDMNIIFTPATVNTPRPEVKAATLVKLVERLTYEKYPSPKFMMQFLLTYRSFTDPESFSQLLFDRYMGVPSKDTEDYVLTKQRPIRLGVRNMFKAWFLYFPHDFEACELLMSRLLSFIDVMVWTHMEASAANLTKLLNQPKTEGSRSASSWPTPVSIIPNDNILSLHPEELAHQITSIEHQMFQEIQTSEYLGQAWTKRPELAPNLLRLIDWSNRMIERVTSAILTEADDEKRIATLKLMLGTADHCKRLSNLNGVVEIMSGLNSSVLHKTWDTIGEPHHANFEELKELVSRDSNFKNFREYLNATKISPPSIPYLEMYLTDLTSIEDGLNDFTPEGLINFDKHRQVAEVILDLRSYQKDLLETGVKSNAYATGLFPPNSPAPASSSSSSLKTCKKESSSCVRGVESCLAHHSHTAVCQKVRQEKPSELPDAMGFCGLFEAMLDEDQWRRQQLGFGDWEFFHTYLSLLSRAQLLCFFDVALGRFLSRVGAFSSMAVSTASPSTCPQPAIHRSRMFEALSTWVKVEWKTFLLPRHRERVLERLRAETSHDPSSSIEWPPEVTASEDDFKPAFYKWVEDRLALDDPAGHCVALLDATIEDRCHLDCLWQVYLQGGVSQGLLRLHDPEISTFPAPPLAPYSPYAPVRQLTELCWRVVVSQPSLAELLIPVEAWFFPASRYQLISHGNEADSGGGGEKLEFWHLNPAELARQMTLRWLYQSSEMFSPWMEKTRPMEPIIPGPSRDNISLGVLRNIHEHWQTIKWITAALLREDTRRLAEQAAIELLDQLLLLNNISGIHQVADCFQYKYHQALHWKED